MPTILDECFNKDTFNWGSNFANSGTSLPAVNIKETAENFEVEIADPGMQKKDFKIELEGHTLTISSEKKDSH